LPRLLVLTLSLVAALLLPGPVAAESCGFVLGFATLHDLIPDVVGPCLENEHHNPANGDALQMTTGGLLVWRKADNWTAFTDGNRTWINGPYGLEERLNTERFPWERPAFSLGIRIDGPDTLAFWNTYAGPYDVAWAGLQNADLVAQARAGIKALTYGRVEDSPRVIDAAKARGITAIAFNREQISDCVALADEEATAYGLAKAQGITFIFAPEGVVLQSCYRQNPGLIQNADIIFYQTEAIQGKDPTYATTVKTLVHNVKATKPGIPVWVQLSVNPPFNRDLSADEVIRAIQSIEDGSADSPDDVHVFYASEPKMIGKAAVMEQVIEAFRAPQ
jgi:hypothetical protein